MQELLFSRSSEAFLCRFNFAGLIIIYYLRRHHRVGRRISTEYGNLFHASQMSHCILFQQLPDSLYLQINAYLLVQYAQHSIEIKLLVSMYLEILRIQVVSNETN